MKADLPEGQRIHTVMPASALGQPTEVATMARSLKTRNFRVFVVQNRNPCPSV
jgi:hypothetical protein